MKTKRGIIILALFAALVLWWLWPRHEAEKVSAPATAAAGQGTNVPGVAEREPFSLPPPELIPEIVRNLTGERERQRRAASERSLNEWRTPIDFYGKAVDENGQPVEGVTATFGVTDLSTDGHSTYHATSDAHGLFSLQGVRGKHLSVNLHKPGYYISNLDPRSFFYAGQNVNFIPNAAQPVLFHLRKHGQAEPLVVWNTTHMVSISGKPLHIDVRTGKAVSSGQNSLTVEYVKGNPSSGKRYDWSFRISILDGGLLLSTAEFDFVAPENGYHSADEIMTAATDENWQARLNRNYFVKLADGNYARIGVDLMAHNGSLRISTFLNPAGSRNLEHRAAEPPPATTWPPRIDLDPNSPEGQYFLEKLRQKQQSE